MDKGKYTQIVLDIAYKIPFAFPKAVGHYAKEYHSNSEYIVSKKQETNEIKKVSLFDSPFYWRGLSFSVFLSGEELWNLRRWQDKRSVIMSESNGEHIISESFDRDNGWVNVGLIRVNQETILDDLFSVHTSNDYFSGVYITLTKYSTGLSFLTFYIGCTQQITDMVSNVNVPEMNFFVEFDTFNVYSRKCQSISLKDCMHHADSIIKNNMKKVKSSAKELIQYLFNEIGIRKDENEVYCVFDMYADQTSPYFDGGVSSDGHHIVFPKSQRLINTMLSDSLDDVFIKNRYVNVSGLDYIYMKVGANISHIEIGKYMSNSGTHLSIVPVLLMSKRIDLISGYLNSAKLHDRKQSIEKIHENLYDVSYQLHLMLAWFKTSRDYIVMSAPLNFRRNVNVAISEQISRIEGLREVSEGIYSLSDNRIQIRNIKYNKRYSGMVFVLVIIQIVLASMTIDWGKNDSWYSTVAIWFRSFF